MIAHALKSSLDSIAKSNVFEAGKCANDDFVSTTMLAKSYGVDARPHLFNFLMEQQLITKPGKTYQLTARGKLHGGKYRENEKGERWIIWPKQAMASVIKQFKQHKGKAMSAAMVFAQCDFSGTIDHMTHIDNLSRILKHGLLPHGNSQQKVDISNGDVNKLRNKVEPIFGRKVHSYVPFYFNARNAMLFRNQNRFGDDIIILGCKQSLLDKPKMLVTDGNASSEYTKFSSDLDFLTKLNWRRIFSSSWSNYGDIDYSLRSQMMAEVLVADRVEVNYLEVIYCRTWAMKRKIEHCFTLGNIRVEVRPQQYFER